MSLTGDYQVSQVLVKVLNVPICLVADVGVDLWSWCISDVAAIREDSRVHSTNELISMLDDIFLQCIACTTSMLFNIWCIW